MASIPQLLRTKISDKLFKFSYRYLHQCTVQLNAVLTSRSSEIHLFNLKTNSKAMTMNVGNSLFKKHIGYSRLQSARNVSFSSRSHYCGEIGEQNVGEIVTIAGWVQCSRMDRFLILRDRTGICQIFIPKSSSLSDLIKVPNESVVTLSGVVRLRPENQRNPDMNTGSIEVEVQKVLNVSTAKSDLPFQQNPHLIPKEELRLQFRYLDLRRSSLQQKLKFRSDLVMKMRQFLIREQFLDVETPTLFRRTPGGAKEFIVPTQKKDHFYSLVQSPQQFKQLLMVAGIDRYFQIARCYRDEGGKPDRQPEFTQVDIEMSFAGREEIFNLTEQLLRVAWPGSLETPFMRITYQQCMKQYGVDKPDLRFENEIQDVTNLFSESGFDVLDQHLGGDMMAGILLFETDDKNKNKLLKIAEKETRDQLQHLFLSFSNQPLNIVSPLTIDNGKLKNSVIRKCGQQVEEKLKSFLNIRNGAGFIVFGSKDFVLPVLGKKRVLMSRSLIPNLEKRNDKILWVLDFPLFTWEDGQLESAHHPFTAPHPEDIHLFRTDPLKARSLHYDLVLNGQEIGGGSVRIHSCLDQKYVLESILKEDSTELNHLLEGLDSGCPPHAGIALGLDRLVAILTKADSIRDVIAFPKSGDGRDIMAGAPSIISSEQRKLYHL